MIRESRLFQVYLGVKNVFISSVRQELIVHGNVRGKSFVLILSITFTLNLYVQNQILLSNNEKSTILSIISLLQL